MKKIVFGILAHVDAGKTTLSEALLYRSGAVRKLGRVDHGDAFLDTDVLERARGITILAKQAVFPLGADEATLLDTPGHVDFSAEAERTLQVLDAAILVISGTDGVQGHTQTLWNLLKRHGIPTFLFINKMDLAGADRAKLMDELRTRLDEGCVDFGDDDMMESIAVQDEALLERYLEGGGIEDHEIAGLIARRKVFPCRFGAALKVEGVDELLSDLDRFAPRYDYPMEFGAKVFKISRDEQGSRLTHLKVTGGVLRVRDLVAGAEWQEKVNQIRIYAGNKFKTVDEAGAGTVCAVTGLTRTMPGEGLGIEQNSAAPVLEPVLTYRVNLPEGCDVHDMLRKIRQLEEEDPMLRVVWNERLAEIQVQLMGEIQLEVLTQRIADRFSADVTFDECNIVYKETIATPAIGIGHFEPLRHYAECQLLLEPGAPGSGFRTDSVCHVDVLDLNWQRLIMGHLSEKTHIGVLTGSPITDIKITLLTGRAHLKHTEGGDFRQATYRAVRQGLMQAEPVLLEPWYDYRLTVPQDMIGRAMTDIQRMDGTFEPPGTEGEMAVLTGTAPVASMRGYPREVAAYTRGLGQLFCTVRGYAPCHNTEEIVAKIGYDPVRDTENTPDSVFCAHGAGYNVRWDEVPAHAHCSAGITLEDAAPIPEAAPERISRSSGGVGGFSGDKELEEIFVRTYGPIKNRGLDAFQQSRKRGPEIDAKVMSRIAKDDYLLVDGYNIIHAWDDLADIAKDDLNAAREALINTLSNYQGVKKCHLILVFDAYKVKGNPGSVEKLYNIHVVYTKEAETADMYIEKASYDLSREHRVKVATSDALEQMIILGHGSERLSANDLKWEVEQAERQISDFIKKNQ
ncbi:MAG: TetM/TetW/TetO/TetS family tetracycline resistance ribosomal protection protein [Butyricicoccus sp.]|nr:TetM/TetW/TetO/TetS family tetracycline resistance ribosomal protection protein [Butyricicoccus sp.]